MYCQFCGRPVVIGQACQLPDCPSRQPVQNPNQPGYVYQMKRPDHLSPPVVQWDAAKPEKKKRKGLSGIELFGLIFFVFIMFSIVVGLSNSGTTSSPSSPSSQSIPALVQPDNQVDQALINDVKRVLIDYQDINDDAEITISTCDDVGFADLNIRTAELTERMQSLTTRMQSANAATKTIAQQSSLALEVEIARSTVVAERIETECL